LLLPLATHKTQINDLGQQIVSAVSIIAGVTIELRSSSKVRLRAFASRAECNDLPFQHGF